MTSFTQPDCCGAGACAGAFMTREPVVVHASSTPRELARLMLEHHISGAPVVDDAGRLTGVVSKTDLLNWCLRGGLGFGASDLLRSLADGVSGTRMDAVDLGIVADFMSMQPITATSDESIAVVACRMRQHRVHRVVVIEPPDRVIGVITAFDLLRALCPSPDGQPICRKS